MKNVEKLEKNECLLWFGGWTSKFGNIIFDYANSISIACAFTGNPKILAIYQSSESIIQIIFNLIGGAKADKGSRKKIAIVTDVLAAIICFVLSFFVASGFMAEVMIIANALLALVHAFNSPTYKSLIREMIKKDRIGFYNAVGNAGGEIISVAGPVVGVWLVGIIGVRGALLFDAGTFLVSALAESMLNKLDGEEKKAESGKRSNVFLDIKDGFAYLLREKKILFLLILASLVNFFLAGYNLLLPYTEVMFDGLLPHFYSKALAAGAIGGIAGSVILAKFSKKLGNSEVPMIFFLMCTGLALILVPVVALLGIPALCLIPFVLFEAALTAFNIRFMSYVQVSVDENYLGRVFSIIFTVAVLFMPVGSFAFSMILNVAKISSFLVVGIGIAVLSAGSFVINARMK